MNTTLPGTPKLVTPNQGVLALRALQSSRGLAAALGVSYGKHLTYYLYRLPKPARYRTFQTPKRGGGERTISAPNSGLILVQRRLSKLLYSAYSPRQGVHGFALDKSIYTNASPHVRRRNVLNIDILDFFGAINFGRVHGMLLAPPYSLSAEVATTIAQICCHENKLPQGAPTSPIISNMICGRLDAQLKGLAKSTSCYFTRYADDITLSSNDRSFPPGLASHEYDDQKRRTIIGDDLRHVIEENGFQINDDKSRLLAREDRQVVTGLVVNRHVNVPRKYIRNVRGALHAWRTFQYEAAQTQFLQKYLAVGESQSSPSLEKVLYGRIQFIGSIKGRDNPVYVTLRDQFNDLATVKIKAAGDQKLEKLRGAVWVIEDEVGIEQGTAFFLKGVGLVSCAHCVGEKPYIYHPDAPAKRFPVSVSAIHPTIDIAVLTCDPEPEHTELVPQAFQSTVELRTDVMLAGYPQHAAGKNLSVKEGKVQSFTMKSGIRRINISSPIIAGNSGGPLLSRYFRVIGVAVTGADSLAAAAETEEHGVVPVSAIAQVLTSAHAGTAGLPG